MQQYQGKEFSLSYPANWKLFAGQDSSVVMIAAPSGIQQSQNRVIVGYGTILAYCRPKETNASLRQTTDEFASQLRTTAILKGNPDEKEAPPLPCRFYDLQPTCITKVAESQASDQTIMAIAGHLSRTMPVHDSHIRMALKRAAVDAITKPIEPAILGAGSYEKPYQLPESGNAGLANPLN